MAAASTSHLVVMSQKLSEEILATHADDSTLQIIDLKPLVDVIDSIFLNAALASRGAYGTLSDSSLENIGGMRLVLNDIRNVSCEMSCNLLGNMDATTMAVLRRLKKYPWNAKVVVAIAAFASGVGELLMLLNHRTTDPIAKSVDVLKRYSFKLDFTVLSPLLKALMDVVNTSFAFSVPPVSNLPKEAASFKDAMEYFPTATYKILRIAVQIASLLSKREDNVDLVIRRLVIEVNEINSLLQEKLQRCKKQATEGVPPPHVTETVELQPQPQPKPKPHPHPQPQPQPWLQPQPLHPHWPQPQHWPELSEEVWELIPKINYLELIHKIKYSLKIEVPEKLRNKHMLFLISDLDISIEEIKVLNKLYAKNNQWYEIVWLPIVDVTTYEKTKFWELKQLMKWDAVEPSKIGATVIEYIKKEWHFVKNPIAVSLNPEGEVSCINALPMLWTWGNSAFPFTDKRHKDLWSKIDDQTGWRLEFLVDDQIDQGISSLIWSGTFVCLFGGGNMSWIQDFTEKVRKATMAAGVTLKLVYVGSHKGKAGVGRNELSPDITVIESESQWLFWTRLESILYAKIQQGKTTKTDRVMQEASKVLGYASNGEAWATFAMGTAAAMVTTSGEMALTIMSNYTYWRKDTTGPRFLEALRNYYMATKRPAYDHGCINVHLPVLGDQIPGIVICPECSKEMKMYYTYRCCVE